MQTERVTFLTSAEHQAALDSFAKESVKNLAIDLYSVDKRVLRIETIIEMTSARGSQPPRIEG
jgi:hypothetical protein